MKTFLQAQKALAAAEGNLARAEKGKNAKEIAAARTLVEAAHEDVITAASKDPALRAEYRKAIEAKATFDLGRAGAKVIHHERYEKKTIEQPDSEPASSAPASSEEEEAASGPPASGDPDSGAPSTKDSEEEGRKAKKAKGAAPKMRKKSEERRGESEEEEEESALAACYEAADKAYKKEARTRGIDAYGYRGPSALLRAAQKAHGTTALHETFGALEAVPQQKAAQAALDQRLGKLEANGRAQRVDAMLDGARDKVTAKEHRKELRALAMEKGTGWLKGHLAVLPKQLRTLDEAREADEGEDGRGSTSAIHTKDQAKIIEAATMGMSAEAKAAFMEDLGAELGKKRAKAAVV